MPAAEGVSCPSRFAYAIDGVRIHKYAPAPQVRGPLGYRVEFCYAWLRTALIAGRVWRQRPFAVIQAYNPPDTVASVA